MNKPTQITETQTLTVEEREYKETIEALDRATQPAEEGGSRCFAAITKATGYKNNALTAMLNGVQSQYIRTRRIQLYLQKEGFLPKSFQEVEL